MCIMHTYGYVRMLSFVVQTCTLTEMFFEFEPAFLEVLFLALLVLRYALVAFLFMINSPE